MRCVALAAALLAIAAASVEPERKPGPHLFLDESEIADMGGAKIKLHRPVEGAKVIESTEPWENRRIWAYHAMLHNGSHVLLYYYVVSELDVLANKLGPGKDADKTQVYTCLATSTDGGRSFQKPNLGVIAWNGTKDNNIVWPPGLCTNQPVPRRYPSGHETGTVYIDTKPGVPAAEKYKMVATWTPRSGVSGAYTMSSPDGVHFIAMSTQPSYTGSDTGQVGFFDERLGKYVAYRRSWITIPSLQKRDTEWCVATAGDPPVAKCGSCPGAGRNIARCLSDDPAHFPGCHCHGTAAANCTMVLSFDEHDPPCLDLYINNAVPYADHYLLFPSGYLHYPNPPSWPCGNDGVWDSRIASSRDGTSFKYIGGDRSPWLQRGRWGGFPPAKCNRVNSADHSDDASFVPPGSDWDSSMVGAVRGYFIEDDEIVMFKWGDSVRHGQGLDVVAPKTGMSRLTLRLDGWASVSSTSAEWPVGSPQNGTGATSAHVLTKPLTLPTAGATTLHVNVDVQASGSLVVEMLDAGTGKALAGHTAQDCVPIMGNYVDVAVQWQGSGAASSSLLSAGLARSVQLKFLLKGDVDIFSYEFAAASE